MTYVAVRAIYVTSAGMVCLVSDMENPVYDVTKGCDGRGMQLLMKGDEACDASETDFELITTDSLPPRVARPAVRIPKLDDDPALVAGYFTDGLVRIWVEPHRAVVERLFGVYREPRLERTKKKRTQPTRSQGSRSTSPSACMVRAGACAVRASRGGVHAPGGGLHAGRVPQGGIPPSECLRRAFRGGVGMHALHRRVACVLRRGAGGVTRSACARTAGCMQFVGCAGGRLQQLAKTVGNATPAGRTPERPEISSRSQGSASAADRRT